MKAELSAASRGGTIPGLTGLRGIGAVWVVLYHWSGTRYANVPVISAGYLGVDLFFLLSGFVLTHVYLGRLTLSWSDYREFLVIRLARIYPLHLFVLVCLVGAILLVPELTAFVSHPEKRFSVPGLFANLFLLQTFFPKYAVSWNEPAWSISAEWLAYLLFPLLLYGVRKVTSRVVALRLAFASLLTFAVILLALGQPDPQVIVRGALLRMICEFLAGCLLYRAYYLALSLPARRTMAAALGLIAVGVLIPLPGLTFLPLFGFALTLLLVAQQDGVISRFAEARPVMFLGEISYSIYMVHFPILMVSAWLMPRFSVSGSAVAAWDLGMLLVTLGAATGTYHLIERPARAWGRRLAVHRFARHASPLRPGPR